MRARTRCALPWLALAGLALLAGCTTGRGPDPFARFQIYAPGGTVIAQLPLRDTGAEAYQGHAGLAYPVGAAPPVHDTGSERIPDFPAAGPPMVQRGGLVLMPNGGERIVQSVNSLP